MLRYLTILLVVFIPGAISQILAQTYQIQFIAQRISSHASLRGLCTVDSKTAWASGSAGQYLHTSDGNAWKSEIVPGADSLDFRDVEAFNTTTAYLMSAGPGEKSRIYKTNNGGQSWVLQLTNRHEAGFFDGMAFSDSENGIVYSDPVQGKLLIFKTQDGGKHWQQIPPASLPGLQEGEYGFAASGTGIRLIPDNHLWICTGGAVARILNSVDGGTHWQAFATPILHGTPSSGIFSIAFRDNLHGVAVGGDYTHPDVSQNTSARSSDGGRHWQVPESAPNMGYRSGVTYIPATSPPHLIAVGADGVSFSDNDGLTWSSSDSTGYHVISFGHSRDSGWVAGADGRIARIIVTEGRK